MKFFSFLFLLGFARSILAASNMDLLEIEIQQIQEELNAIQKSSLSADAKNPSIQKTQSKLNLLLERNRIFPARISSANAFYHIYATNIQNAHRYMNEADQVYSQYRQLFTDYHFSSQYPAHMVVYPDRPTYLKYEQMSSSIAGHAISDRLTFKKYIETEAGLELEEELRADTKLQRLAFYMTSGDDPNQTTFAHELVHIFNWDMLNQNAPVGSEITPNLFLNEGLAEHFAALNNEEQHQLRITPLRRIANPIGPWDWLGSKTYPSFMRVREFYSEGYLFARWLAGQKPNAGKRLQALLRVHSMDEAEAAIQQLTQQYVPKIDLENYLEYRQKILSE